LAGALGDDGRRFRRHDAHASPTCDRG
jgi:hypothetical protein